MNTQDIDRLQRRVISLQVWCPLQISLRVGAALLLGATARHSRMVLGGTASLWHWRLLESALLCALWQSAN